MDEEIHKIRTIDPSGCNCLSEDCINEDSPEIEQVLEAAMQGEITLKSNLNDGALIAWRSSDGKIATKIAHDLQSYHDCMLIEPGEVSACDEQRVIELSSLKKYDGKIQSVLVEKIIAGRPYSNNSNSAWLIWSSGIACHAKELKDYGTGSMTIAWP